MRLIDADALKERIRRFLSIRSLDDLLPEEKAIVQHIDRMLPVDAVPVVRCKDCKSFLHGFCRFHNAKFVRYNGYCYWGERKDGDGNG